MEITIYLAHAGIQDGVEVPAGSTLGHVRELQQSLEALAVPSDYNLAIQGLNQPDTTPLSPGDVVTFRPVSSSKG